MLVDAVYWVETQVGEVCEVTGIFLLALKSLCALSNEPHPLIGLV